MLRIANFLVALLVGVTGGAGSLSAQDYPKKHPIKIVVPVPAGGLTDALARLSAEFLQRQLGQNVIVDNRPGASSTIGVGLVARAPADGYTLLFVGTELAVVPAVRNVPYKLDQLTYLTKSFSLTPLILASPGAPFSTTAELVAYMRANPGKARYGSTGIGAVNHMATAMFETAAGVKGLHVPYAGIAPVYVDLMAGHIDFTYGGFVPFPDGRGLKVLGPSGKRRHLAYPSMPTLEEIGIKGASWDLWLVYAAPPGLPKPIADRLIAELEALAKDPEYVARAQDLIKVAPEGQPLGGEALKNWIVEEHEYWKTVAEREKISVQE